eukprot:2484998-Alexandrium_andersonii.AAC.1
MRRVLRRLLFADQCVSRVVRLWCSGQPPVIAGKPLYHSAYCRSSALSKQVEWSDLLALPPDA